MKYASTLLLLLFGALLQGACSTQAVYTGETFSSDSPFRMRAEGEVSMACESARRALLGQGYLIESASTESVKARKAYKTVDTQNTFIEMNIVCLGDVSGSTLYATGVLTSYALKKSTSSASVGLSALGSISLPIGQSADSLVKVSEETIDDKDFYKRFFSAVDTILVEMRATRESAVPAAAVAVEPGPAPETTLLPATAPVPAAAPAATPAATPAAMPAAMPATSGAPPLVQEEQQQAQEPVPAGAAPTPVAVPVPQDGAATRAAPITAEAQSETASPAADSVLEPFPTRTVPEPSTQTTASEPAPPPSPVVAPAPEHVQATPAVPLEPESSAAPATPAMVLEEFAAPRNEPFR